MNPTSTFFRNVFLSVLMLTLFSAGDLMGQTYCAATATSSSQEFISNVHVGIINKTSDNTSPSNYSDYTALSTNMERGIPYTITIKNGPPNYSGDKCGIWVDWNHDGDFADAGEAITVNNTPSVGPYNATIIPPSGAALGATRLRIRISFMTPIYCGNQDYGEVEDYTINVISSGPMAYQSTTVTQNNTSGAPKCGNNLEIIGIEVVTSGSSSPLNLSKFVIRTAGSTSPAITNNVSNIDIYYTGTNSEFGATTLFGSAPPQPATGDINIGGSQTLASGTNYFWVVYDMNSSSAVTGNSLDAELTKVTVNSTTHTIPAGAPWGSRTITDCVASPGGVAENNTLWLDGNTNITMAGNLVSKWTSSAPGSYSVIQSINSKKPIFNASDPGYNYNPYLKFNGAQEIAYKQLGYPAPITYFLRSTGTVILVSAPVSGGNPQGETILADNTELSPDYQIKPGFNGGFGHTGSSPAWQIPLDSILPSIAAPNSRPQIIGLKGGATGFAFKNGHYSTSGTTTGIGANVEEALTLGSRGYIYNQSREYSKATLSEVILYERALTTPELDRIQSYLALKYGITLGVNGTSKNYLSADGSVIWNSASNAGYNYDIAGIGRDDIGNMDKRKSHSINGTGSGYSDILTVTSGNNFNFPTTITQNASYFVWGRNNADATGDYLVDVAAPVITRLSRVWKAQETGNAGTLTLEFDMSQVPGVDNPGDNDLNAIRLIVDADGVFASGATEIAPTYVDNVNHIIRFQHDFDPSTGYYFTVGSVDFFIAPLPIELSSFTAECNGHSVEINWTTQSETNNAFFTIEKSVDAKIFKPVATINGQGNSTSTTNYSWVDDANIPAIAYYRLKQTDFDGKSEYHDVISKDCGNDFPFRIYPNPTKDGVFIQNYNMSKDGLDIEVYNSLGQKIDQMKISESSWIDLPDAQGIYFLRVRDGAKVYSEKVVKN